MNRPPPEECANCGAAIPRTARACPECGADERIGWREEPSEDGLDLPEGHDRDSRTGHQSPPRREINGLAWYWWCAGIALVVLLVLGAIRFS